MSLLLLLLLFAHLVELLRSAAGPVLGHVRLRGAGLTLLAPLADEPVLALGVGALEAAHLPLEVERLPVLALAHRHLLKRVH